MELKYKILIVEDEPLLAENLSVQLKKAGYEISGIAGSLTDAVAVLKKEGADLAVIDIGLDGPEDGIETAEMLIKTRWIPIIYLTGRPLVESLAKAKATAPAAFLQKPVRYQELVVQIELALHNFREGNLPSVFWGDSDLFFVPYEKGHLALHVNDILYIKADSNYARVYLTQQSFSRMYPKKTYTAIRVFVPMGTLHREFPNHFFLMSRFEVINLKRIDTIGKGNLFMENHEIEIREGRRGALFSQLRVVQRNKGA